MAPYRLVEALLQGGDIEPAGEPDARAQMIGGVAGLKLVQEPEPLLHERRRENKNFFRHHNTVSLSESFLNASGSEVTPLGEVFTRYLSRERGTGPDGVDLLPFCSALSITSAIAAIVED